MNLYAVVVKRHRYHGELIVNKVDSISCLAISQSYSDAVKMKKDIIQEHGHKNFYIQKFLKAKGKKS